MTAPESMLALALNIGRIMRPPFCFRKTGIYRSMVRIHIHAVGPVHQFLVRMGRAGVGAVTEADDVLAVLTRRERDADTPVFTCRPIPGGFRWRAAARRPPV